MDNDWVKERNETIKHYLKVTPRRLRTPTDILVLQIIQTNKKFTKHPELIDLDSLYDLEVEYIVKVLEREALAMDVREVHYKQAQLNKINLFDDWDEDEEEEC